MSIKLKGMRFVNGKLDKVSEEKFKEAFLKNNSKEEVKEKLSDELLGVKKDKGMTNDEYKEWMNKYHDLWVKASNKLVDIKKVMG